MAVLVFVFQDFAHWLGAFLMLCVVCQTFGWVVQALCRRRVP